MEPYCPLLISGTFDTSYPAKKNNNELEGYTDFSVDYFENDGAKVVPTETELKLAKEDAEKKIANRVANPSGKTKKDILLGSNAQIQDNTKVAYADTYRETDAMLRQTIAQTDVLASEIKGDIDKIRASTTMKSKYTYLTNLTSAQASIISTKIAAIKEINASIKNAHELELKRTKDLKESQRDQQTDDSRMMDMYNAFINSPMGMYNNALQMPTVPDMMLGTNGMNPTVQGISIAAGAGANQPLTPEQIRMRMEGNPNIEEVVMYEPSTGRRWFQIVDNSTGQPVTNIPTTDEFFLSDVTLDVRTGTARNRNLDKVWRLVNTESTVVEY